MAKAFKDKRLPKGVSIWHNDWEEYVAIEYGRIAEHERTAIRGSRTLEGAIQNYLNKNILMGPLV